MTQVQIPPPPDVIFKWIQNFRQLPERYPKNVYIAFKISHP